MSDQPKRSYTRTIDLTSRAKREQKSEQAAKSFLEPDPPLDEMNLAQLPDRLRAAVSSAGWTSLMPVQAKAIPYLLDGQDIIVQSKTGSGKTGAFLLPLLNSLDASVQRTQALILSPTRELAKQIYEEFERLTVGDALNATVIYGGVKYQPQLKALEEGVHVVVGTPGRILDHIERRTLRLEHISSFILDEADEMLSMGFLPDMRKLKRYLPAKRQSCMFSATMPSRVQMLAKDFLREPGFLSLSTGNVSVDAIEHQYYRVDNISKDRALVRIIELENPDSAIIFANTKREVEYLGTFLSNYGYDADSLTGDLSQNARERVMAKIRAGKLRFLVATDVAARGIDISDLSHVFMVDVPQDQEYYIHRAGRTARAGKTGTAIALVSIADETTLKRLAHKYAFELERVDMPSQEDIEKRVSERMTVTLESIYRDKSNLIRERMARFVPLIEELSREEPELLAMLVDDLYHNRLHGKTQPEAPTESPESEDAEDAGDRPKHARRKNKRRSRGDRRDDGGESRGRRND